MKKIFFVLGIFLISCNIFSLSIKDIIEDFDLKLMEENSAIVQITVGNITYADTETSGTIVKYFETEIKKSCAESRRLKIVDSSTADENVQVVIATRSPNFGMVAKAKKSYLKPFVLDGIYTESADSILLELKLLNPNGETIKKGIAEFSKDISEIKDLSLFPENLRLVQEVNKDFSSLVQTEDKTKSSKIKIAASMLDENGNLVKILHPGDRVLFKISTDKDSFIAIQGIDATGDVYWLPLEDNFIQGGSFKTFPDENTIFQVMDGIFGAESLIIHAAETNETLPSKSGEGAYRPGIISTTRGIGAVKTSGGGVPKGAFGQFKITYTVVEE